MTRTRYIGTSGGGQRQTKIHRYKNSVQIEFLFGTSVLAQRTCTQQGSIFVDRSLSIIYTIIPHFWTCSPFQWQQRLNSIRVLLFACYWVDHVLKSPIFRTNTDPRCTATRSLSSPTGLLNEPFTGHSSRQQHYIRDKSIKAYTQQSNSYKGHSSISVIRVLA